MNLLTISFEVPPFSDLADGSYLHTIGEGTVAVLDGGMETGRPSIAIRLPLKGAVKVGKLEPTDIVFETSARLFCTAAKMIMAKYPELFNDH